jgi:hypothetical protein
MRSDEMSADDHPLDRSRHRGQPRSRCQGAPDGSRCAASIWSCSCPGDRSHPLGADRRWLRGAPRRASAHMDDPEVKGQNSALGVARQARSLPQMIERQQPSRM